MPNEIRRDGIQPKIRYAVGMSPRCILAVFIAALLASASHISAEEMRAAWVATVFNINFPSQQGLSPEAQKAEISRIVQTARKLGLNALMVQVRPEGDALYESRLEPWSRFLTGTQGKSPGYDPLATFI
ncbi:MAG: family 10 glycosylhydrolase, partial [Chthoniobacterales bacterium]